MCVLPKSTLHQGNESSLAVLVQFPKQRSGSCTVFLLLPSTANKEPNAVGDPSHFEQYTLLLLVTWSRAILPINKQQKYYVMT